MWKIDSACTPLHKKFNFATFGLSPSKTKNWKYGMFSKTKKENSDFFLALETDFLIKFCEKVVENCEECQKTRLTTSLFDTAYLHDKLFIEYFDENDITIKIQAGYVHQQLWRFKKVKLEKMSSNFIA